MQSALLCKKQRPSEEACLRAARSRTLTVSAVRTVNLAVEHVAVNLCLHDPLVSAPKGQRLRQAWEFHAEHRSVLHVRLKDQLILATHVPVQLRAGRRGQ